MPAGDSGAERVAEGLDQAAQSARNQGDNEAADAFAGAAAGIRAAGLNEDQAEALAAEVNAGHSGFEPGDIPDDNSDDDGGDGDGGDGDGGGGDGGGGD